MDAGQLRAFFAKESRKYCTRVLGLSQVRAAINSFSNLTHVVGEGGRFLVGRRVDSIFLSSAQPTDQGEVSVVLLLLVGGGTIIDLTKYSFLGCEKATK